MSKFKPGGGKWPWRWAMTGLGLGLGLLIVMPATALAAQMGPNLLQNGDFESPSIGATFTMVSNGTTGLPGWTVSGGGVEIMRSFWVPESGQQSLDLSNYGTATIDQSIPTSPGSKYLVSWYIAGNPNCKQTTVRGLSIFWNGLLVDTTTFEESMHTVNAMGWTLMSIPELATGATSSVRFARDVKGGACGVAIDNVAVQIEGAVAQPSPRAASPSKSPVSTPAVGASGASGTNRQGDGANRSTITSSLPSPGQAFGSWKSVLISALVAVVAILLITFPAQLFNKTLSDNYEEIVAFWERHLPFLKGMRAKLLVRHDQARSRTTVAGVVLLGALLGGLLDPHFGFNGHSFTTYLAVVLSTLWGIGVSIGALWVYRRLRHRETAWRLRALPVGLGIAALCVVISRLTDFEPGTFTG